MSRRRTNPDFLNGVPELLVLRLIDREPMYGYQIVEALRAKEVERAEQVLEENWRVGMEQLLVRLGEP